MNCAECIKYAKEEGIDYEELEETQCAYCDQAILESIEEW